MGRWVLGGLFPPSRTCLRFYAWIRGNGARDKSRIEEPLRSPKYAHLIAAPTRRPVHILRTLKMGYNGSMKKLAAKRKVRQFTVVIEQDEDGYSVATVPSLPSCFGMKPGEFLEWRS